MFSTKYPSGGQNIHKKCDYSFGEQNIHSEEYKIHSQTEISFWRTKYPFEVQKIHSEAKIPIRSHIRMKDKVYF